MKLNQTPQFAPDGCRRQVLQASLMALDQGYRRQQRNRDMRRVAFVLIVAAGSFGAGRLTQIKPVHPQEPMIVLSPRIAKQANVEGVQAEAGDRYRAVTEKVPAGFWRNKMLMAMKSGGEKTLFSAGRSQSIWTQYKIYRQERQNGN